MILTLQICQTCGAVQYPQRAVCGQCLSADLVMEDVSGEGTILSWTLGHVSALPDFKSRMPIQIARIQLNLGPRVLAFVGKDSRTGQKVRVTRSEETGALTAEPL